MGEQVENIPGDHPTKWPKLSGLNDLDNINNQFIDLLMIIDKEESQLTGDTDFPYEHLNHCGNIEYAEMCCYDAGKLERLLWEQDEVVRRIEIQECLIQKVLAWINGKLSKAIALMPDGLLDYKETDVKYHMLAKHYTVVQYLLTEKEHYNRQMLHWKHLAKNTEKKTRMLWHRLLHIEKEK